MTELEHLTKKIEWYELIYRWVALASLINLAVCVWYPVIEYILS